MVALRSLLALLPASFHMSEKIRKCPASEVTTTYQLDALVVGGIAAPTKASYTPREIEASKMVTNGDGSVVPYQSIHKFVSKLHP